ncbi:MAG: GNAT family N-acetyltransferase [Candidatus Brocadiae bacterium]|nr:GNAT family N-acetyltransferase [Candidatus Brocadiia bacterium]
MAFGTRPVDDGTIRTARLHLRPLLFADAPALFEAVDSSRRTLERWLPWAAAVDSPDSLNLFIDRTLRENHEGCAHRAILEPDGRIAGHISLERRTETAGEFGYWIRSDRENRGYATEAARALLHHAFRHLGVHRVAAYTDVDNIASSRVLARVGFTREGIVRHRVRAPGGWRDHILHGLLDGELRP